MIINDRIFGKEKITSPVIIELIKSKPLQRLKKICQFGVPDEFYFKKNYTRFEHCLGVAILLKKLGGSQEEQIAGLLHDVSHTAFSHIIDWVLGDGKTEDFQDKQHKNFIEKSEIPQILKKYNYKTERITNYHNFGLLERDLPNLCADRIDYSIREFPVSIAKKCIENLTTAENKIVFKNKKSALLFAENFLKLQIEHWGGAEATSRFRLFADVLRIAIEEKIIEKDDFWKTDEYIIKKFKKSNNKNVNKILNALKSKSLANFPKSKKIVHKKFRYVDPLFLENKKLIPLSKVNKNFAKELKNAKLENRKGILIPKVL